MEEITFDESVKRRKAVEWLLQNDVFTQTAASHATRSPVAAILLAAEHGATLAEKIAEVAKNMEVTEGDRRGLGHTDLINQLPRGATIEQ